ncbi:MAG: dihydropteroate synthase [Candidatus Margulisiibacteriota bacterium]
MRIIEISSPSEAIEELKKIHCDPAGIEIMAPKSVFKAVKLKNIRSVAANIIKQEMLSYGGEAATSYGSLDLSAKTTDIIIMGTLRQFKHLTDKLRKHQFGLPQISKEIKKALDNYAASPAPVKIKGKPLPFGKKTYIMGILNVTPDSFSDGGKFLDADSAISHADRMIKEGADIIDVGGESTRPGAASVPAKIEMDRIIPVIRALSKRKIIISVDTRKASVAEAAVKAGAHIINDISGLRHDKKMARVAAKYGVPVVVMHIKGTPKTMQFLTNYEDIMMELIDYFEKSIEIAENAGILRNQIIIDPGFGFGKTPEQNLEIIKHLRELKVLGSPILIGTSRKSTIGKVLDLPAGQRIEGTAATVSVAILNGADIIRVHDVDQMKKVVKMTDAIARGKIKW